MEHDSTTAKIRCVDRPEEEPILVSHERLRRCPEQDADDYWSLNNVHRRGKEKGYRGRTGADEKETSPITAENDMDQQVPDQALESSDRVKHPLF